MYTECKFAIGENIGKARLADGGGILKQKKALTATKRPALPGLRQRKRAQTRERLTQAAMTLFLERGFEATTLDDIAAVADISRRNFFHYFASKEDVVFAWQEEFGAALADLVAVQPDGLPLREMAENALIGLTAKFSRDEALALARLIHQTPVLRARDQVKYEALERQLGAALRARHPGDDNVLRVRLIAMATIGALRVAADAWLAEGGHETPELFARRAFKALRADLA